MYIAENGDIFGGNSTSSTPLTAFQQAQLMELRKKQLVEAQGGQYTIPKRYKPTGTIKVPGVPVPPAPKPGQVIRPKRRKPRRGPRRGPRQMRKQRMPVKPKKTFLQKYGLPLGIGLGTLALGYAVLR